jgi:hypothetical protein
MHVIQSDFCGCCGIISKWIQPKGEITVNWYDYIACFFAGMFLANAVPHFVHGISGDRFPTPFAHPPGKGLSSPTVNVAWALLNLLAGYILFRLEKVWVGDYTVFVVFFAGVIAISTWLSIHFTKKNPAVGRQRSKK